MLGVSSFAFELPSNNREKSISLHDPSDPFMIDVDSFTLQMDCDPAIAITRKVPMDHFDKIPQQVIILYFSLD
jgi:hypothetical protein